MVQYWLNDFFLCFVFFHALFFHSTESHVFFKDNKVVFWVNKGAYAKDSNALGELFESTWLEEVIEIESKVYSCNSGS